MIVREWYNYRDAASRDAADQEWLAADLRYDSIGRNDPPSEQMFWWYVRQEIDAMCNRISKGAMR